MCTLLCEWVLRDTLAQKSSVFYNWVWNPSVIYVISSEYWVKPWLVYNCWPEYWSDIFTIQPHLVWWAVGLWQAMSTCPNNTTRAVAIYVHKSPVKRLWQVMSICLVWKAVAIYVHKSSKLFMIESWRNVLQGGFGKLCPYVSYERAVVVFQPNAQCFNVRTGYDHVFRHFIQATVADYVHKFRKSNELAVAI